MSEQRLPPQPNSSANASSHTLGSSGGMNSRAPSIPPPMPSAGPMQPGGPMSASQMPQVQVIHQSMPTPPYLSQFPYNQQFMLQNAAAIQAAMQAQVMNSQFNLAALQGRVTSVSPQSPTVPSIMGPSSGSVSSQPMATVPSTPTPGISLATSQSPTGTSARMSSSAKSPSNGVQQTASSMMAKAQSQFVQRQMANAAASQPIVIGQIGGMGMLQSQNAPGFMTGHSDPGNKSGAPATMPAHSQVYSQSQMRLPSQPPQLNSSAQILTPSMLAANPALLQAMANFQQGLPFAHIAGQMPAQPLYIRTGGLVQPNAQPTQQVVPNVTKPHCQSLPATSKQSESSSEPSVKQSGVVTAKPNHQNRSLSAILPMSSKPAAVTAKVQPTNVGSAPSAAKVPATAIPSVVSKQTKTPTTSSRLNIPHVSTGVTKTPATTKPRTKPTKTTTVAAAIAQAKSAKLASLQKSGSATTAVATTTTLVTLTTAVVTTSAPNVVSETRVTSSVPTLVSTTAATTILVSPNVTNSTVAVTTSTQPPVTGVTAAKDATKIPETAPNEETSVAVVQQKKQAIVKPQILTHVIDGFVIQEGPEPFPIQRSSLLTEFIPPASYGHKLSDKESEEDGPPCLTPEPSPGDKQHAAVRKCEYCGKVDKDKKFRRSKRFCSMACSKRYNIGFSRRWDKHSDVSQKQAPEQHSPSEPLKLTRKRKHSLKAHHSTWHIERPSKLQPNTSEYMSGGDDMSSSLGDRESSSSPPDTPPSQRAVNDDTIANANTNPATWSVQEVYEFVRSLKGCDTYADEFRTQEIDGQALLLLKEDHLMSAMSMKLGPALKICAQITSIKQDFS